MKNYGKVNPFSSHRNQFGLALLVLLALALTLWRKSSAEIVGAKQSLPDLQGVAALEHLRQQGLYDSLGKAVVAAQHMIRPTEQRPLPSRLPNAEQMKRDAAYLAENTEQQLRARFTARGAEVEPQTGAGWRLGLQLRSYGYP